MSDVCHQKYQTKTSQFDCHAAELNTCQSTDPYSTNGRENRLIIALLKPGKKQERIHIVPL